MKTEVLPVLDSELQEGFDGLPALLHPADSRVVPTTPRLALRSYRRNQRGRFFFVAKRQGKFVGRLAGAIHPHRLSAGRPLGIFGGWLQRSGTELSRLLFDALRREFRSRGVVRFEGPSALAFPGSGPVLIHGFESSQAFGVGWNSREAAESLAGASLRPTCELYGYRLDLRVDGIRQLLRWAAPALRAGLKVRSIRRSQLGDELERASRFPHPDPHPAHLLRGALSTSHLSFRKGFCLRVERRRVPLGYVFGIPDLSPLLYRFRGKPPTASALLLRRFSREISAVRWLPPLIAPVGIEEGLVPAVLCLLSGSLLAQVHRKGFRHVDAGPVPSEREDLIEQLAVLKAKRDRVYASYLGKIP